MNLPKVEIISLIYRSTAYAAHIINELKNTQSTKCELSWRLVANDATKEVEDFLVKEKVPYSSYRNTFPDEYYLNRVYRAYNFAASTSEADIVCLVNSDMMFSEGFVDSLLEVYEKFPNSIPCSLLIESGNLSSMAPAISYDCGRTLSTINRSKFEEACYTIKKNIGWEFYEGGLFMPCLLPQWLFDKNNENYFPYPCGNIYEDGPGMLGSRFLESGDSWYFRQLLNRFGLQHITTSSSITYHLQEGELKERD